VQRRPLLEIIRGAGVNSSNGRWGKAAVLGCGGPLGAAASGPHAVASRGQSWDRQPPNSCPWQLFPEGEAVETRPSSGHGCP